MNVTRFDAAPPYDAPGHFDMSMVRIQGREAGTTDTVWLGISTIEPGGRTSLSASDVEKIYVVLEGELRIGNGQEEVKLARWDSCRIAPNEARLIHNDTQELARILLVMPYQQTR